MIFNKDIFLLFCVSILILNCGVYSFKGSSIPKDAQSIYIFEIQNNSPLSSPELSSLITENLNNYILSEMPNSLAVNDLLPLYFSSAFFIIFIS